MRNFLIVSRNSAPLIQKTNFPFFYLEKMTFFKLYFFTKKKFFYVLNLKEKNKQRVKTLIERCARALVTVSSFLNYRNLEAIFSKFLFFLNLMNYKNLFNISKTLQGIQRYANKISVIKKIQISIALGRNAFNYNFSIDFKYFYLFSIQIFFSLINELKNSTKNFQKSGAKNVCRKTRKR